MMLFTDNLGVWGWAPSWILMILKRSSFFRLKMDHPLTKAKRICDHRADLVEDLGAVYQLLCYMLPSESNPYHKNMLLPSFTKSKFSISILLLTVTYIFYFNFPFLFDLTKHSHDTTWFFTRTPKTMPKPATQVVSKSIRIHLRLGTSGEAISGWWFQSTPLKNDGVRRDDEIPIYEMEK